ncbi:uncharacterized protein LOC123522572 [Echinops telfairi]|uniref:Uncharacterized protein LOC123522572 n=1 Tax=Echinops telfairi TaxID=9371 RepID=A0AC55DQC1_ECHTE|nr:uncharacterized protein LOC123522572 [Echinops telfairi]
MHAKSRLQHPEAVQVPLLLNTHQDHLEPPVFPMQRGSLNLLRQKWESSDYQKSECCPGGSRCRLFQPQENKLLGPEGERVSAPASPDPPSQPCRVEEVPSSLSEKGPEEDKRDNPRGGGPLEVLKEDSVRSRRRIERFSIALEELRSVFEAPRSEGRPAGPAEDAPQEAEVERSVRSPTFKSRPRSQSEDSVNPSATKGGEASFDKMSSESGHSQIFEG